MQKTIENALNQNTAEALYKKQKTGDFLTLRQNAQIFLDNIKHLLDHQQKILGLKQLNKEMQQYKILHNEATQAVRVLSYQQGLFQKALNDFFNREMYVSYVSDDGDIDFIDQVKMIDFYKENAEIEFRGNLNERGNITKDSMKKFLNENKKIENNIKIQLLNSISQKKQVYAAAIQRWKKNQVEDWIREKTIKGRITNNKIKINGKQYDPSIHTFYWRLRNDRNISGWTDEIKSLGWIAQAYVDVVVFDRKEVNINNYSTRGLEYGLKHLASYINQDNVPASIKQDVVLKQQTGQIHFAVKSDDFSLAGFSQFISLANNITKITRQLTEKDFELVLPKLIRTSQKSQKIIEYLNKNAAQYLLKAINIAQN